MRLICARADDLGDEERAMLDLVIVQEDALIECGSLVRTRTRRALGSTSVLPGHGHILRRRNRKARLSSWGKLPPKGDLPVARAVRRCCKRPLRGLDPAADEDDILRFEIESAHVPRKLVPSCVVEKDVLCEVPARVEDLPVGVVLEDEHGASLFRKLEAQAR